LKVVHEALPSDDPRKRQPDISKARRILGWEPKVSLEDGILETISYFKAREGAGARR
jgi:nucleoside-diphosphate-sugar epimerase